MSEHTAQVKVLLVDDDPEVLSSFRQYFATTKDIRVVAEAHDGVEALTVLDNVPLDIILADIHMPEMDGVTLLHEVRRRTDPPPFVAITAFDGDETMLRVLAGGGAGYIVKSSRPQAIISAVRDALTGGITVSPQALSRLVDYIPDNVPLDIILADIHMPEMDGVTLLHEVRRRTDPPPFVAITAFDGDETMLRVLAGGGAGYIVKSSRPQAIISAVRDALTGGITVSPQALSRLVDYIPDNVSASAVHRADSFSAYKDLTKVEARILHYICQGLSNAEIASAMKYSEATVKKHVSHLIARFGATSRLSLAITVIQSKLGKSW